MSPLVAGTAPDSTLISVDFPAPLSPSRPTISFWCTVRFTCSSARTRPYDLLMFSMRISSSAMALVPGLMPAFESGVQGHHAEDDGADEDVVGESGHADQYDAVAHDPENENADHSADDRATPPNQGGATNDHHRDDFQLIAGAAVGIGGGGADRADDAGKGRHHSGQHEQKDLGALDIDAPGARGIRVAAGRLDPVAEPGLGQNVAEDDHHDDEPEQRHVDAERSDVKVTDQQLGKPMVAG